jgi:D-amino-acid oxidase
MKRVVDVRPQLTRGGSIEGSGVVIHTLGLRPCRVDSVRLEKEFLDGVGWPIHNCGHAGYGYQVSYGCAEAVRKLFIEFGNVKKRNYNRQ